MKLIVIKDNCSNVYYNQCSCNIYNFKLTLNLNAANLKRNSKANTTLKTMFKTSRTCV